MTTDYTRAAVAYHVGLRNQSRRILADIRADAAADAPADAMAAAVAATVASALRVLAAAADAADDNNLHYRADAIRYAAHLVAADAPRGGAGDE